MYRVGYGFDIHRLVVDRRLIVGGVEIPYIRGLQGHSDADVLLHAVTDAVLGALGKGDLGELFPDTDPTYKDAASSTLLERVQTMCAEEGYSVINLDTVVIAQEPHMAPYKKMIQKNIAALLGVAESVVSIKAKTHEGIGELGAAGAIAAHAVVMLQRRQR